MPATSLSSREFNQDTSKAKRASANGPVFITDRGRPAHVLLSIEEYQRLRGPRRNLAETLYMPGLEDLEDIELETSLPPEEPRAADFS